ncbi:hypothetical protein ABDJ41_19905 [Pedobacter sp. ASV1-7]|uniref:hypothetical protein n=1 Tax=Pedobacter sp. ASV1-7 TaxID=3145237 RepID=UPI0032E872E6
MDIVKHIKQHTENLQNVFGRLSAEQAKNVKLAVMEFYYLLPGFEEAINRYIGINVSKNQLRTDILNQKTESYSQAIEKSNAEVDEYADDYEELEQISIFILDAFENAVADTKKKASVVALFLGIIDTLDHYENFSEEPNTGTIYWNRK